MKSSDPLILTINGGSSSITFALFESGDSVRPLVGRIARSGLPSVLGIEPSESRNRQGAGAIFTESSQVTVRVIQADEQLMIARSVVRSCPSLGHHQCPAPAEGKPMSYSEETP